MDPEEWEQMVTISFDWEGDPKPVSTSFVGTYVKPSYKHVHRCLMQEIALQLFYILYARVH